MAEQEGGDISEDDGDAAQTVGRIIREQDDGQQRSKEGHEIFMVKEKFFYADDGMVVSTDLGWLHLAFDTLTGIFDRVGLQTNF